QPRERKQHEARRRDPVIDAGARGVAVDRHRLARIHLVARHHVIGSVPHDVRPLASLLALSSSSGFTRLAPVNSVWMRPNAAVSPMIAMPAYFAPPFHTSTNGEIRGLFGRLA